MGTDVQTFKPLLLTVGVRPVTLSFVKPLPLKIWLLTQILLKSSTIIVFALTSLPDFKQLRAKAILSSSIFYHLQYSIQCLAYCICLIVVVILVMMKNSITLSLIINYLIVFQCLEWIAPLLACITQSFLDTFNDFPMISWKEKKVLQKK